MYVKAGRPYYRTDFTLQSKVTHADSKDTLFVSATVYIIFPYNIATTYYAKNFTLGQGGADLPESATETVQLVPFRVIWSITAARRFSQHQ